MELLFSDCIYYNEWLGYFVGPETDNATLEWNTQHKEELYDLNSSQNIIWVIKSRRVRSVGHVECMGGEERCIQGFGGET
jgi:hypothetical protein